MTAMKIRDIRATTVTVPLEAPIRHAHGAHWGRFVRTIVEVETDTGLIGLGEMGGGGASAEREFRALKPYLVGHDPFNLEELRWKIWNPTANIYNTRGQVHAAIEFACIDIMGKALGVPASTLLGGALRQEVPFASYVFYRYPDPKTGIGGEETPEEIVSYTKALKERCGFNTHKLKGGVFAPNHDIEVMEALAEAFPRDRLRIDPNGVWSVDDGIRVGRALLGAGCNVEYFEDPTWGMEGMRRVRAAVDIPTATNQVVINNEQLASCIRTNAVDVILLDTTIWGGMRQAWKAAVVCETFQWGVGVHSSGELGIQLATMLHLGAVLPNLTFAADAHYHHLTDDIIVGGKMRYRNGCLPVPTGPGLGVELDRDRLKRYSELYRELGGYSYDRDPERPGWFSMNWSNTYADPKQK
jgi:glucarate dehydratase